MGLDFKAKLELTINNTSPNDHSSPADAFTYSKQFGLAPGVGANQADLLWYDQRTLAGTTAEDLDLSGALSDVFGVAFDLVKLKGIFITKVSGTGPLQVFGQGTNGVVNVVGAAADLVSIGDMLALMQRSAAGWAITAGTADLLQVNNVGGDSVTYDIFLVGTSS